MPVVKFNEIQIADGKPGKYTKMLIKEFEKLVKEKFVNFDRIGYKITMELNAFTLQMIEKARVDINRHKRLQSWCNG